MKFKSNPFDVPLPTPSQLPAKNGGDFSLSPAADKSQIVPVALFEVADTSESGYEPPPCLASARGMRGTDLPYESGVGNVPRGPTAPRGCPTPSASLGPEPGGVTGCQHPAGPTSAVGEPVERVALVAEALEAARGVDAEVVAGPVKGALIDVWREGKGRR